MMLVPAAADEDNLADLDDDLEEELDAFESDLQQAIDIFREQRAKGNKKFLERFMDVCRSRLGCYSSLLSLHIQLLPRNEPYNV